MKKMKEKFLLIGLDGGASKINGWIIDYSPGQNDFKLSSMNAEVKYSDIKGFDPNFTPVSLKKQLSENEMDKIKLTQEEINQGKIYIEACSEVIYSLAEQSSIKRVMVGIGMPGLKTKNKKGIAVLANGPRIISYLEQLENRINLLNIKLIKQISLLGSDADYCGIGEE